MIKELDRFLLKFKMSAPDRPNDCWLWQAWIDPYGYGGFHFRGRCERAHRVSWLIFRGPIPKGLCVLHQCDTPACVNPRHLFLGTRTDNSIDKTLKGRAAKKLTPDMVRAIRKETGRQKDIGEKYGVSQLVVWQILHGVIWKHVK